VQIVKLFCKLLFCWTFNM